MSSQPHPVGDPVRAFVATLKRAHRAEEKVRNLKARIADLEAQMASLNARLDALENGNNE